ncbi:adenylosuccinate synthase, partial [Candidatus Roizmanbacteria bacterium CG_4_10_14_0_8_um_filter_33_9]
GAHGTFLDGVFGTYPYTTAIHTISGAVFPYVGIAPQRIFSIGIVKAYTTRVGNGPFPTELFDNIGAKIREVGREFGTVSKRPRRCGWLDLPLLRTAVRLSGFSSIVLTKIDVLSQLKELFICTHYELNGKKISEVPSCIVDFNKCKPVYKKMKGWDVDLSSIKTWQNLPKEVQKYVQFIEKQLGIPVSILSVGPERGQEIFL